MRRSQERNQRRRARLPGLRSLAFVRRRKKPDASSTDSLHRVLPHSSRPQPPLSRPWLDTSRWGIVGVTWAPAHAEDTRGRGWLRHSHGGPRHAELGSVLHHLRPGRELSRLRPALRWTGHAALSAPSGRRLRPHRGVAGGGRRPVPRWRYETMPGVEEPELRDVAVDEWAPDPRCRAGQVWARAEHGNGAG